MYINLSAIVLSYLTFRSLIQLSLSLNPLNIQQNKKDSLQLGGISYLSHRIIDSFPRIIKISFVSPEGLKARTIKSGFIPEI